jgi:hypothetical protein
MRTERRIPARPFVSPDAHVSIEEVGKLPTTLAIQHLTPWPVRAGMWRTASLATTHVVNLLPSFDPIQQRGADYFTGEAAMHAMLCLRLAAWLSSR